MRPSVVKTTMSKRLAVGFGLEAFIMEVLAVPVFQFNASARGCDVPTCAAKSSAACAATAVNSSENRITSDSSTAGVILRARVPFSLRMELIWVEEELGGNDTQPPATSTTTKPVNHSGARLERSSRIIVVRSFAD